MRLALTRCGVVYLVSQGLGEPMFSRLGSSLVRHARPRAVPAAARRVLAVRRLGSGGHHGEDFHVSEVHLEVGKVMAAVCWTWMLWRAYNDGAVVLGLMHPWDAHGHGHHDAHVTFKETGFDLPVEVEEAEEGHGHDDEEEEEEDEE